MSQVLERRTAMMNQQMIPLSDQDLKRQCPSIFAEAPRNDVSSRYGFVSSAKVLTALRENGFVPTHARDYNKRDPSNRGFAKHLVRFRQESASLKKLVKGDVVPQIIMVNSHDRSSLFQFFGGLFRLVCSNGLMVSESSVVSPIVVRHTTSTVNEVLQACDALIKAQKGVFEHVNEMRGTTLDEKRALRFANEALELRPTRAGAIESSKLLESRRTEDAGMDLWSVYNRVQENLMRGGLAGVTAANRAVVTRGVDSINADLHINTGLWRLAMEAITTARTSSAATVRRSKAAKPAEPVEAPNA
jgi:hypothetical protein